MAASSTTWLPQSLLRLFLLKCLTPWLLMLVWRAVHSWPRMQHRDTKVVTRRVVATRRATQVEATTRRAMGMAASSNRVLWACP